MGNTIAIFSNSIPLHNFSTILCKYSSYCTLDSYVLFTSSCKFVSYQGLISTSIKEKISSINTSVFKSTKNKTINLKSHHYCIILLPSFAGGMVGGKVGG